MQEVLEPLVHDEVPYVPAVQDRRSFFIGPAAGGEDLWEDVVIRQVVVEFESGGLSIVTECRLDIGDFAHSDFDPDFGKEKPFVCLEAYLGR
jgi:hypothetical protein